MKYIVSAKEWSVHYERIKFIRSSYIQTGSVQSCSRTTEFQITCTNTREKW